MLDLAEVVNDPDLGGGPCIIRTTGYFGPGGWLTNPPKTICAGGVVSIADDRALRMVPEGDRVVGSLMYITTTQIFVTNAAGSQTSDQVQWNGDLYRVQSVGSWVQNGFYVAVLLRITGA
jgi:hypothetical protein